MCRSHGCWPLACRFAISYRALQTHLKSVKCDMSTGCKAIKRAGPQFWGPQFWAAQDREQLLRADTHGVGIPPNLPRVRPPQFAKIESFHRLQLRHPPSRPQKGTLATLWARGGVTQLQAVPQKWQWRFDCMPGRAAPQPALPHTPVWRHERRVAEVVRHHD
eukprot:360530-Chlamydomonas_euryale.AAC.6